MATKKTGVRVREDDRMNSTGRYVSKAYAQKHPDKTTHERTKLIPKGR